MAITGAEAHAAALGMTGDMKKQYLDGALKETFDVERLSNGCFKIKTDSPWIPGGVMVMKSGESITVDIPGMGKTEVSLQHGRDLTSPGHCRTSDTRAATPGCR